MQHLFGSLLFKKLVINGNCNNHISALCTSNDEGVVVTEALQRRTTCNACGCTVDEENFHNVEYVPASYLQGKYVLLYVTEPTDVVDATSSQFSGVAPTSSFTGFSTSLVPPFLGTPQHAGGVNSSVHTTPLTAASSSAGSGNNRAYFRQKISPQNIKSLILTFCRLLARQLLVSVSPQGEKDVLSVVVLEVRRPEYRDGDALLCCDLSKEQVSTPATLKTGAKSYLSAVDSAGNVNFHVPIGGVDADILGFEERQLVTEFVHETDPVAVDNIPSFSGWLLLENMAAHRQIIRLFGVTSWPSVLLFGPDGGLLTRHALDHIGREMTSYANEVCQQLHFFVGEDAQQGRSCGSAFYSDFPWVTEMLDAETGEKKMQSADSFAVSSILKRLFFFARRVGDVFDDGISGDVDDDKCIARSGSMVNEAVPTQLENCLDGATHLLLYFGSGWHPSSHSFLLRLRHFFSYVNSFGGDNCGVDVGDYVGNVQDLPAFCAERSTLRKRGSLGASFFLASHSVLSQSQEAAACCQRASTFSVSDSVEILSKDLFQVAPQRAPVLSDTKEDWEESDLFALLEGDTTTKKMRGVSAQLCGGDELTLAYKLQHSKQQESIRLQVIYVSCDTDKSQFFSLLESVPSSWLCVSSIFGHSQRKLIEMCMDFFGVCVFPRLVVTKVTSKQQSVFDDIPCEPTILINQNSDNTVTTASTGNSTSFRVVNLNGEGAVLLGYGAKGLLEPGENSTNLQWLPFRGSALCEYLLRDECSSGLRSFFLDGGCIFVLCGMGKVSAEVYKTCLTTFQEAGLWWSREVERLTTCLNSFFAQSPDSCMSREKLEKFFCLFVANETKGTAMDTISAEAFFLAIADKQAVSLPVYFFDAIVVGSEADDNNDDDTLDTRNANEEEKHLLQEFVISELLGSERSLPPIKGEPFLVFLQWPERRVAVLRRKFEFENNTSTQTSTGAAACARLYCAPAASANNSTNLTCVVGAECRQVGAVVTTGEGPQAECVSSQETSTPVKSQGEGVLETSMDSPLCCLPQVKTFIARHVLHQSF